MSRLEDVYDEGGRRRAVVLATFLLVGTSVAVVGFVAATASLVAGFGLGKAGALKVATLLGGVLSLGAFLVLFARGSTTGPSRLLASVGATFAVVGLVLFWTTLPAGWTGRPAGLPTLAVATFAVGLLAVFAARFADEPDGGSADAPGSAGASEVHSLGGVEGVSTGPVRRDVPSSSAVGDGGSDEEDLRFFDEDS